MNKYYAVTRSTDHLAHYGIKGMKWGVKRAKAQGLHSQRGQRTLNRQYKRAQKKLAKLNRIADVQEQKAQIRKHGKRALIGLGVGAAGLGVYARNEAVAKAARELLAKQAAEQSPAARAAKELMERKSSARQKHIITDGKGNPVYGKPIQKRGEGLGTGAVGINPDSNAFKQTTRMNADSSAVSTVKKSSGRSPYEKIRGASAVAGMAGFGVAAYQAGRAVAAKRRTTAKGHAKAVAKRDAFKREMDRAFAGTIYQQKNGGVNRKRLKKRK